MKYKNYVIAFIALLILGFSFVLYSEREESAKDFIIVGGDRDTHGCIGSAGYVWCDHQSSCVRPWELAAEQKISLNEQTIDAYCMKK